MCFFVSDCFSIIYFFDFYLNFFFFSFLLNLWLSCLATTSPPDSSESVTIEEFAQSKEIQAFIKKVCWVCVFFFFFFFFFVWFRFWVFYSICRLSSYCLVLSYLCVILMLLLLLQTESRRWCAEDCRRESWKIIGRQKQTNVGA